MSSEPFGTLPDGTQVHRWTIERAGVRARVLSYGGILQSLEAPDQAGRTADVVLGMPRLDDYLTYTGPYYGALVGRYANRIAGGRFTLDDRVVHLEQNGGPNSLHGGSGGFDKRVWKVTETDHGVRLARSSPHGEEGFPGWLEVTAEYTLDEDGALSIAYEAVTDAPTVVNLTNHAYWNLAGAAARNAGVQQLRLAASRFTPVDDNLIPTGELAEVAGTRFDFLEQREIGPGYDHNFVLDKGVTDKPVEITEMWDPRSGRVLTISTTEPGIQVYTGEHLQGPYASGDGVALETQHFPDSPNQPSFPSTVLRPGHVFRSETVYALSAR